MMASSYLSIVVVLLAASCACGAEWVSPDGKISFQTPDDEAFVAVPNPTAPLIAQWSSRDGAANIAFLSVSNPTDEPLEQRGLEDGSAKASGGAVVSSRQTSISGIPAFTIVTRGTRDGQQIYYMQTVVAFGGNVYKLMAGSTQDVSADQHVGKVFQSLCILDPTPKAPGSPGRSGSDSHNLSVQIARWGIIILVIALVVTLLRKQGAKA